MTLPLTTLADGTTFPRLVVGGWQLSEGHRQTPRPEEEILDDLVELARMGLTTFDCADIYTGVEALFGRFREECRQRLGSHVAQRLRFHTKLVPDRSALTSVDRACVERVIDRSLARLRTDRLDLVQFAWWDYDVPGYVETVGWLGEMRRAGKVRAIGVTNFDTARLEEILDAGVDVTTHQVQYSALDNRPEAGMTALCLEREIRLLCYGTLAGGFLSDRYLDAPDPGSSLANRSLTKYRLVIDEFGGWSAFQELLRALRLLADELDASVAQVALAYVLDRPGVGAAILGMSRAARIKEAVSSMDLALSDIQVAHIRELAATAPGPAGDCFELERVKGGRHASIMKYDLNRESGS